MNEENRTLETLDYFRGLIASLDNGYNEPMDVLIRLRQAINDALEDKIISQQMYDDYQELFDNQMHGMGLRTEDLLEVANRHLAQFDGAYNQMTKSLEFDKDAVQNSEKDSKEVLEQIKDAMEKYADAYSEQNGALSAVVEFSDIGNIIKDALKEDKLSKSTALRLLEPLQHMKEDMFNPGTQKSKYDAFQNIIQKRLDRADEKEETNEGQEKEGILAKAGNVLDKAANVVASDVKKAFQKGKKKEKEEIEPDKAKEQQIKKDEEPVAEQGADKKFDFYMGQKRPDKQSKAQETPHKPDLERKEETKDVSQKNDDVMQREDKVQEEKQQEPNGQEEALLRLKSSINKYRAVKADKSASYADLSDAREAYNDAIKDPLLRDFTTRFYTTDARMADVYYNQSKLLEWIDRELGNGHKQEKQGQRENKNTSPEIVHDNTAKGPKTEPQTKEKALENLRQLWKNLHETRANWSEHPRLEGLQESNKLFNDFHQALRNPELKDIADEYYKISRNPFENGLPNYEAVMDAINKGFGPAERPQQILGPDDMARGADLSKKQEAKDISSKPENLMQREDKTESKVNANEKTPENYEDLIYGLEDVLAHHKDRDPESFKRMMFALKDLSQQGLLPEEMKKEYMDVFNRVKEFSDNPARHEHGATQLSQKIVEQLDNLEAKQQTQNQTIPVPNAQYNPSLEKKEEAKDISPKPENLMQREEAHSNSSIEQRSMDRSGKDAPYDLKREEHIENYVQGNKKVQEMSDKKDAQHKTLDQQALAAYRRKMLLGRGGGNV